jgi:cbb3-type cytochrome c oxidase subunit III
VLKRVVDTLQVLALLGAAAFVVLLFANEPDDAPTTSSGQEIFTANCAQCHGPEGEGGTGPRLAGTVVEEYPDEQDQIAVVRDGRGSMPSFRDRLSPEQIRAVVEYTREELPSS